ncbi:unannotated protein [freshwater metagenome]|uniref:Unannotated protein n=1 Tax=freshwater metagenome TaxID=449393 RepID=A0A6J6GTK2_9ZZZZ
MDNCIESEVGTCPDGHVARQHHRTGEGHTITECTIVREMGLVHEEASVPERCRSVHTLLDHDKLVEDVAITDRHARARRFGGPGPMGSIAVLRGLADGHERADPVVVADDARSQDHRIRANDVSVAELDSRSDDRSGVDLVHAPRCSSLVTSGREPVRSRSNEIVPPPRVGLRGISAGWSRARHRPRQSRRVLRTRPSAREDDLHR